MTEISVTPVDRLVVSCSPWDWPFSRERSQDIRAHFDKLKQQKPTLWNGRVLMLRDFVLDGREFRGRYFETDFANLLAWRDWDFPDPTVKNSFAMGALRASDGAFILGEMATHTANAGKIYFPAGTPDPEDVQRGSVDLLGSVIREVEEETGLTPADFALEPGWFTVQAGPRIAQMKPLRAASPAAELRGRILDNLRSQKHPELSDIHIVRGPADLTDAMPPFMGAFLRYVWQQD
jgi:8-oxo-dGTP pyrophosphatase MutT (NUDIX family)